MRIAPGLPTAIVRAVPIAAIGALTVALAGCAVGGPDSGRRTVTVDEAATTGTRSIVATTESGDVTIGY